MGKQLLKSWFALIGTLLLLQSCGTFMQQPVQSEPARIGEATQTAINLKNRRCIKCNAQIDDNKDKS